MVVENDKIFMVLFFFLFFLPHYSSISTTLFAQHLPSLASLLLSTPPLLALLPQWWPELGVYRL